MARKYQAVAAARARRMNELMSKKFNSDKPENKNGDASKTAPETPPENPHRRLLRRIDESNR